jgi:hypothetical protein
VVPPSEGTSYRGAEGVAAHTSAPPSPYPDWPDGSIIYRGGDEPNLRVVDRIEPATDELFTVLVVEPVE